MMRIPLRGLAALPLLLAACTVPCRPVPHGQEPLGGIWPWGTGRHGTVQAASSSGRAASPRRGIRIISVSA